MHLLKGAAATKGMISMMADWSMELPGLVRTDANAAMGIVHRQGLGKTRHIEVQYLWIQDAVRHKKEIGCE